MTDYKTTENDILAEARKRVLVLDGAMGTMIQKHNLSEKDFRGERFKESQNILKGFNDLLTLTRPDIIRSIHEQYLEAGADIIETDTFNANAISMADYGLSNLVREINVKGAGLAREAVEGHLKKTGRRCWVAGSMAF